MLTSYEDFFLFFFSDLTLILLSSESSSGQCAEAITDYMTDLSSGAAP